ncbi:hypothetical protein Glove_86g66 [Diversispora epigaea]|uniref:Uncharacterized protein n=1 Tax=Diversispora epigaea TaxID=1348612 RepID=A0A397J6V7_9GLOM|nr:hypothetical protein Glove_86g66 [Diversispora epigaea]
MSYELSYNTNGPLRKTSEECAIQLHHYTPQDEIDKGIFCLFANKKSNPKELFEALQEIIKNRENNLNNNKNNSNGIENSSGGKDLTVMRIWMKIESADEVYEKMIEFEKKGIRPTSFFQNSFQLLEEENEENLVGSI